MSFPGFGIIIISDTFHEDGKIPMRKMALKIHRTNLRASFGNSQIMSGEILSIPGDFFS